MIEDVLVSIERLQPDSDNPNKEQYQANMALQDVMMNIQPASAEQIALSGGAYFQSYAGYTTRSGILQGDHLTVSGTNRKFTVKGIQNWAETDLIPHYELLLVEGAEEVILA